jgi:predicted nucleic acid-binding protein
VKGFLLDTNVASDSAKPRPEPKVERWLNETQDELLFLSVISIAELFKGIASVPQGKKRTQLEFWMETTLRPFFADRLLPVTEQIAERLGVWTGQAKSKGFTVEMADGIIAATAFEHDLTLVTRNVRDFAVFGLPLLNPWDSE